MLKSVKYCLGNKTKVTLKVTMVDCISMATKVSSIGVLKSINYCQSNSTKVTLKVTMVDCFSITTESKVSGISAFECKVLSQ